MILIDKNNTAETIICTLNESKTINEPYFLFVFTHVTTKEIVKFVKSYANDASEYQSRYNQFEIDATDLFANATKGQWQYQIYEQDNDENIDVAWLNVLECGKMKLIGTTANVFAGYDTTTTYKGYNG
jgi:ferredoxin-like protein FixX